MQIRETGAYATWFEGLTDPQAQARILVRIRRLSLGNPGDVQPVGKGVSELRIHYGPGYRVYFVWRGRAKVMLLAGGTKSTQDRDIKLALEISNLVTSDPHAEEAHHDKGLGPCAASHDRLSDRRIHRSRARRR